MKQKKVDIAELLDKFFQGETGEAEEQLLTDYFVHTEHIPEEWSLYKELFRSFRTDAYDFSSEEIDAMESASMAAGQPIGKRSRRHFRLVARWMAVAACLPVVIWTVGFRPWTSPKEENPAPVSQEITVGELLETLTILAETTPEDATITATHRAGGIEVSTSTLQGTSVTYTLRRRADNSTLELISQLVQN
ncbi:MAG: hypothetical protein ACI37U_03555 [Bacteroides sp.]